MENKNYNRRTWLNREDSPSTGNVVAFDGEFIHEGKKINNTFLSIGSCNVSARLHRCDDDSMQDFVDKMKLLRDEIDLFVNHLEDKYGK